jgi:hypothetical protein
VRLAARQPSDDDGDVLGVVIIAIVLVVVIPVAVLVSGAFASAGLGWLLKDEVEREHAGSELIELNR